MVGVKFIRLEVKPAERGRNGERLAVWQVNNRRSHDFCERTTRVFCSQRGKCSVVKQSEARYIAEPMLALAHHADRADIGVGS